MLNLSVTFQLRRKGESKVCTGLREIPVLSHDNSIRARLSDLSLAVEPPRRASAPFKHDAPLNAARSNNLDLLLSRCGTEVKDDRTSHDSCYYADRV